VIDTRNQLDGLILSTERMIKDAGDKLPPNVKGELETAINEAKTHLNSEVLSELKGAMDRLQDVAHKVASDMYAQQAQAQQAQQQQAGPQQAGPQPGATPNGDKKDDVMDADYKEV